MSATYTIECDVEFGRESRGRKVFRPKTDQKPVPEGRIPRIAKLMALAIRFD